MIRLFSYVLIFSLTALRAQLPESDVWLFKLVQNKQGQISVEKPVNISNRSGYDNQPSFSEDGKKIYYVSVRSDKQSDIYVYDIRKKKNIQLTTSKQSEYSPKVISGSNILSSVVVEEDSSQRIHLISASSGSFVSKLKADSVGYYSFLNSDTVVYYKLTQPHSLWMHTRSSNTEFKLCDHPTRTFRPVNRHSLIYGIKDSAKVSIYKYDFLIRKAVKYAEYQNLCEDMIWHKDIGLLLSDGTKLMRYDASAKKWLVLFDLSAFGIKKISRFDFDSKFKYLILVNNS
jgi:hypothetical protein